VIQSHENYKWIDALPCPVSDYNACTKVRAADLDVYLVEKILNTHNSWIHKDNVI